MVTEAIVGMIFLFVFLPLPVFLFRKIARAMAELTYERGELLDLKRNIGSNIRASCPKLLSGALFSEKPRLEFNIKGHSCRLYLTRVSKGKLSVSFIMTLDSEGKDLVIEQILRGLGKDSQIGSSKFSRRFSVRSSFPEGTSKGTLSDNFQDFLMSFSEERESCFSISCSSKRILFEESAAPEDLSSYPELFDELATLASGFSRSGFLIEMVSSAAPGKCPVCSTPVGSSRSLCNSCHTPHHPECWAYNEGCAVYACSCKEKTEVYPALE
jgi:hypothetical protein